MINRQNFFDQPVKNNIGTCNNIIKITAGQGDDHTSGIWLFYLYFKEHYKMMAIYLNQQQAVDAYQKQYKKSIALEI